MPPNVRGQRGNMMAKIHYKSIPEVEWWRTRWKNQPYISIVQISLHMTPNRYNNPGYIRVQWPWIGMIQNMTCVVIAMYNIDRSESPWWRYTNDHDLHESWIYTMDQDLHNGWRYLTYIGIKSWELKSHEQWNDQGGSIYEMPPIWKVLYTIRYEYMSYYVNRDVEVEHSSPTDNENGNQGSRVQTNKCE